MPRYYFHMLVLSEVIEDRLGAVLAGPEAAHWRALRLAQDVRLHLPPQF